MTKEELKKIIVSELKQTWTHPAEVIADRILARIPDGVLTSEEQLND